MRHQVSVRFRHREKSDISFFSFQGAEFFQEHPYFEFVFILAIVLSVRFILFILILVFIVIIVFIVAFRTRSRPRLPVSLFMSGLCPHFYTAVKLKKTDLIIKEFSGPNVIRAISFLLFNQIWVKKAEETIKNSF